MTVTVYTTGPECHKCNLTKSRLAGAEIPFTEVLLTPELAAEFKARDMGVAPIVVTDTDEWFDFRIDKIKALIEDHKAARLLAAV